MPDFYPTEGNVRYNNGFYIISMSNLGDEKCVFSNTINTSDGLDVVFIHTDSTNSDFGTITCHIKPYDNENGYIITSITREQ